MHAADAVAPLPTAALDDPVLSAVRVVAERGLPGLVVVDEQGATVACMSSVDLLWLVLPRYLREAPRLAWIFDEEHADRLAETLVGTTVRDVVGGLTERTPKVGADATVVELAEMMVRRSCPLVLVEDDTADVLGVATANKVLGALASVVGDEPGQ